MPRTCTVCRLPAESRQKAEESLLAGEPHRSIARRFETSPAAMLRHKGAHLSEKLAKAEAAQTLSAESLLDRVLRFQREAEAILADGKAGRQPAVALAAIGRLTELLKVEGAALQAAREVAGTVCRRCQREDEIRGMTPEARRDELSQMLAMVYVRDPAAFLEGLRNRAAIEIAERRRIPIDAARAALAAMEAGEVRGEGSGQA